MENLHHTAILLVRQGINPIPFSFFSDKSKKSGFSKRPSISHWKEYQTRQMMPEEVDTLFNDQTEGIGIVTGERVGVDVVDCDNDGDSYGFKSPLMASTMNNGIHVYYRHQEGVGVASRGLEGDKKIDIRGDGGLVVIPPSPGYRWLNDLEIKDLRKTFLSLPPFPSELWVDKKPTTKFDLSQVIGATRGSRDDSITRAAMSSAQRIVWNNSPYEFEVISLLSLNRTFDPPLDERLIEKKLKIAIEKAERERRARIITSKARSLQDMVTARIEDRKLEAEAPGTGLPELDKIIKGFVPKHYYTMTGDTNVGKTALALNFAYNLASAGKKVMYYALEPENTVVDYLASIRLKKPFDKVADSDLLWDCPNLSFAIKDDGIATLPALLKKIHDSERFDLVIIDHVGYFVRGGANSFVQEQSNLIKDIVQEAKRKKCAILGIAHIKKPSKVANTEERVISDVDIAGSNAFRTDSTEVLIATRGKNSDGSWANTGNIMVTKTKCSTKGGGTVPIFFAPGGAKISDSPYEVEEIDPETAENISIFN